MASHTYSERMAPRLADALLAAVAHMPLPVVVDRVVWSEHGTVDGIRVEFLNGPAHSLFEAILAAGVAPDSLIDVDLLRVFPPESSRPAFELSVGTAESGRPSHGTWHLPGADGTRTLRFTQVLVPPDRLMSWFEDVTETEVARRERLSAQQAREDLGAALATSPDGYVIVRRAELSDGTGEYAVDFINRSARHLAPNLVEGATIDTDDESNASVLADLDHVWRTGLRRSHLRVGPADLAGPTVTVTVDRLSHSKLLVSLHDISERLELERRAESAVADLQSRRQLMARAFDSMSEALAVFAIHRDAGVVTALTLQLVNVAGARDPADRDADLGSDLSTAIPFSDTTDLGVRMIQAAQTGAADALSLPPVEFRGVRTCFDAQITPVDERTLALVLLDLTDLRNATDELVEAHEREVAQARARSELIDTVAHELRTPLTTVVAAADLLLDTRMTPEQRTLVSQSLAASRMMLNLVNDTLDLGQLNAGPVTFEKVSFDPRDVLDTVIAILGPSASAAGLTLLYECTTDVPASVEGDPTRVQQVLVNLVGNALKFTAEGGVHITLDADEREEGRRLRFDVIDSGSGLTVAEIARVFEPFQQATTSTRRRHGGSGLGLSITRRIVDEMGGSIWVESSPGVGSQFSFTIPLVEGVASVTSSIDPLGSANNFRVLLAEDNEVNAIFVAALLSKLGADVDLAADGLEVLEAATRTDYDLVLMDVKMPGLDGIEATRRIRASEGERRVRIVALTASPTPDVCSEAIAAGMDDVMGKPVSSSDLQHLFATLTV